MRFAGRCKPLHACARCAVVAPMGFLAERLFMSFSNSTDDLASVVRYALTTTRAIAVCPFHENVTIRVGDNAQERHAYLRASKIVKSDRSTWGREVLHEEIERQLAQAADGTCPECEAMQTAKA